MFNRQQLKADFSRAAVTYDAHAQLQYEVMTRLWNMAGVKGCILDAGCGTGALKRYLPHMDITQVDIAPAMCQRAGAVNADAGQLPFADGAFDAVFSSLMLQWTNDPLRVLDELRRVVRSGGVVGVSSFAPGTLRELNEAFAQVDSAAHVSLFTLLPAARIETIVTHAPDMHSIMHGLKALGARYKSAGGRKGMMTPRMLQAAEAYYRRHYEDELGLRVSWEVQYLVEEVI